MIAQGFAFECPEQLFFEIHVIVANFGGKDTMVLIHPGDPMHG